MPSQFRATRVLGLGAIVLVAAAAALAGQESATTPTRSSRALRARGVQLGYDLDHAKAVAAFKEAIAADPNDPAAHRLTAAAAWIDLLFQQGTITVDDYLGQARANVARATPNAALAATVKDSLRRAIDLSETRLREHPTDPDAHYHAGAAYAFLASYGATVEGRVMGSLGPARRAYHEHERVLELDPRRKDAALVVGLYRYGVSGLSAPLRLLAHLAGFGGGRDEGIRLVEEAARYPSDVQANARFTLILIYNREQRYDDALRMIRDLQQQFPRNRLLWLEEGNTDLRAGRPAAAKAALEEGLARLARDPRSRAFGEEARWRYAHGAALAALKEDAAAERELRAALSGATRDWVRGRAHKELGKVADWTGDHARALEEYREADRLCRADHDADCSDEVKALRKNAFVSGGMRQHEGHGCESRTTAGTERLVNKP